jgi:hypothetical protein
MTAAELFSRLTTPEPLTVALLFVAVFCVLTSFKLTNGIKLGPFNAKPPADAFGQLAWLGLGIAILIAGIILLFKQPVYKLDFRKTLVYSPSEDGRKRGETAKRIVVDGDDIYYLLDSGNIYVKEASGAKLIDGGVGTKDIQSAGGKIWILKNNGKIWAYVRPLAEAKIKLGTNPFDKIHDQKGTQKIIPVGDTLYVFKDSGLLYRYVPRYGSSGLTDVHYELVELGAGAENVELIAASSSIIYFYKSDRTLWRYIPSEGSSDLVYKQIHKGDKLRDIVADGSGLYLIKEEDNSVLFYKVRARPIGKNIDARKISSLNGTAYILDYRGIVHRYTVFTELFETLNQLGSSNIDVAVFGKDIFTVESNGSIYKYSEIITKR